MYTFFVCCLLRDILIVYLLFTKGWFHSLLASLFHPSLTLPSPSFTHSLTSHSLIVVTRGRVTRRRGSHLPPSLPTRLTSRCVMSYTVTCVNPHYPVYTHIRTIHYLTHPCSRKLPLPPPIMFRVIVDLSLSLLPYHRKAEPYLPMYSKVA